MTRYYHNVSHDDLLRTTRALLKFCRDHEYVEGGLARLSSCVAALEADNFEAAVTHFRSIPLGGMCCFNDWLPPVVHEHEDDDYVRVVFDSLLERTVRLMRLAAGESPTRTKSKRNIG
jgi:hypothetical protein